VNREEIHARAAKGQEPLTRDFVTALALRISRAETIDQADVELLLRGYSESVDQVRRVREGQGRAIGTIYKLQEGLKTAQKGRKTDGK
jgi:hypothetical protein